MVLLSNNLFIKKNYSKKQLVLNVIGFIVALGLLQSQVFSLQILLTVILLSSICVVGSAFREELFIGVIFQILGVTLILKNIDLKSFTDLQKVQSEALWGEIPSWNIIFQPYAFVLLFMATIFYTQVPFLKSLLICCIVHVFLGGGFTRNISTSSQLIFFSKAVVLMGIINTVEALGFKCIGIINKINNRPIMVLWVLNIINNVFGIFKI
jgi:hypothetical protein